MTAAFYDILSHALGADMNPDNTIEIDDFRGVLSFVYGRNSMAAPEAGAAFSGASDYDGVLTLRCPSKWSDFKRLPFRVGDEFHLPDCIGETVTLSYEVVTAQFTDAVFIHSQLKGVYSRA